ncbi:MAG: hypothetical protein SFW65_04815 [Alphaproteobacteria bacterium]|nr:hypothetical protein [Alphaproteobacteria bacterium]
MPIQIISWFWEEAFDKFGFGDGDDVVMTHVVADVLGRHGYNVTITPWGMHNDIITSILDADGIEQIPETANLGYDEPREYLPESIVKLLDTDPSTGSDVKVRS